jgi:hypothetical protein
MKLRVTYENLNLKVENKVAKVFRVAPFGIPAGISESLITAAGGMIVGSAPSTPSELAAPVSSGMQLTSDLTQAQKMKWVAAAVGGTIDLYNKSGVQLEAGDVCIFDKANALSCKTTTSEADRRAYCVATETIAVNALGKFVTGGLQTVKVTGNVAIGNALITSTTAGRAKANGGSKQNGMIGFAVTAFTGSTGTVTAFLCPDIFRAGAAVNPVASAVSTDAASLVLNCGSGADRLAVVFILSLSAQGPTIGGSAMTLKRNAQTIAGWYMDVFYKVAPSTGNQTIAGLATWNVCIAMSFDGVNQATPFGTEAATNGSSAAPSATITDGVPGDMLLSLFAIDSTSVAVSSYGSGQTEINKKTGGTYGRVAASKKDVTVASEVGSAVLASSVGWGEIGVRIIPS